MAQITIEDLSFSYPDAKKASLKNINMKIEQGEFVLICGESGCGKTTLLRSMKNTIAPYGNKMGKVMIDNVEIEKIDLYSEAGRVGFVFQQPGHQIVTDKVWHELAFGLENMGKKQEEIKLRVAEVAEYFGLTDKMQTDVEGLSGGQKQLLNIASIMAMQPEIVILDEPTAQLDPIAADHLLSTIYKINRDFGITIIMSEHRVGGVLPMADKVVVMDKGEISLFGNPREIAMGLKDKKLFAAMPQAVKIYAEYEESWEKCPLTVGQARKWLSGYYKKDEIYKKYGSSESCQREKRQLAESEMKNNISVEEGLKEPGAIEQRVKKIKGQRVIECKDVWFRYERREQDIVKGLSVNVDNREIFGIVGGNGAGKSTLLSLLCGIMKPYRGKVKTTGKVAMLVQDVTSLFLKDTVKEELENSIKMTKSLSDKNAVEDVVLSMQLEELMEMHPYDLSGGEQQRLGLAKLLLTEPDIILLDEPTKGMDESFKGFFGKLLTEWKEQGKTIVIVSHDIEFLSKHTDRCGMFFEGQLISIDEAGKFFAGNQYYTTELERIMRR